MCDTSKRLRQNERISQEPKSSRTRKLAAVWTVKTRAPNGEALGPATESGFLILKTERSLMLIVVDLKKAL